MLFDLVGELKAAAAKRNAEDGDEDKEKGDPPGDDDDPGDSPGEDGAGLTLAASSTLLHVPTRVKIMPASLKRRQLTC